MEIIEGRITKRNDVIRDSGIYANTFSSNAEKIDYKQWDGKSKTIF